jgi:YHS domain-containing protein
MLDGYCPVGLAAHNQWVRGDARWSVVHQDRLYLMSGPRQKEAFAAAPQRYAPAFRGFDPVLAAEGSQPVEGRSEFSAVYRGRLYLFSSAATLARFRGNPKQYAAPESRL